MISLVWKLGVLTVIVNTIKAELDLMKSMNRRLDVCQSINSWNDWNQVNNKTQGSSCSFLNGICQIDPEIQLKEEMLNQSSSYKYWYNAIQTGVIDFSSILTGELDLYRMSGSNISDNQIWEWKINYNFSVNLIV